MEERSQEQVNEVALRQFLTKHFDEGELRTLCFDLEIDYEHLPSQGKENKVRELVLYARRHGRSNDLAAQSRQQRPDVDWQHIIQPILSDWNAAAERYRGEMQVLYGTMRIIGMAEPVALADIFTDVFLLDKPSAWRRYNIEELQRQLLPEHRGTSGEQRHDALALAQRHERLMILGKPGAGKSTLLKHLVLQCTTGKLDAVPIFVGLKAWADSGLALMPFLTQQFAICAFPNARPFIERILAEGQALVLFDGLDEVNLEQGVRERITREVRDLADQYPRSRCVITCRTAAEDHQFERFAYCELADFTEDQMRTFVAQWFQRDMPKREAFLAEFAKADHHRLRDLGRTPLLLTLLCLTFDETMTFPLRRTEIYEEALDALLKKWDATRSIKRDTVYRQLSLGHKRQMLARIAAETFAANQLFMRQNDLAERIVTYVQRLPPTNAAEEIDGEVILQSIEAQHGLLIERAQRIYSFSHLTFHEYFAARYIAEHPSKKMFRSVVEHAYVGRWREVLLLTASMLDQDNATPFFDTFDASLRTMIQGNPALLPLLQWMQHKAKRAATAQHSTARALYIVLALIGTPALALALARDLALTLDPALAFALESACSLALPLTIDRAPAFDLDLVSDLGLDLHHALGIARALAFDLDLDLHRDTQRPIIETFQIDTAWTGILLWVEVIASAEPDEAIGGDYDKLLGMWHRQTNSASAQLRPALAQLTFPAKAALVENWQQFATDLRAALVEHQDIGHTWKLDTAQLNHLADYLEASIRLLECLDLAAVADRDAIRNRLLLPPQP